MYRRARELDEHPQELEKRGRPWCAIDMSLEMPVQSLHRRPQQLERHGRELTVREQSLAARRKEMRARQQELGEQIRELFAPQQELDTATRAIARAAHDMRLAVHGIWCMWRATSCEKRLVCRSFLWHPIRWISKNSLHYSSNAYIQCFWVNPIGNPPGFAGGGYYP
jgi:hypothetical protein